MAEAITFYVLSALILGFGVLVVSTRNTVHCVLFLVADFLFVAVLYVVLSAEFVAIIQILVYAGGIVVLYLFVVMLVNLKQTPETYFDPRRAWRLGLLVAGAVFVELVAIMVYGIKSSVSPLRHVDAQALPVDGGNVEQLGYLLYTNYLIPFEVASMLLLVAMIGAIVLAKRQ